MVYIAKLVLVLVCLLFSLPSVAKEPSTLSYHLHQSIGHFESWLMFVESDNRCVKSRQQASLHLTSAIQKRTKTSNITFLVLLKSANQVISKGRKASISTVESLRYKLHLLLQTTKKKHLPSWHQAFFRCRKKLPLPPKAP